MKHVATKAVGFLLALAFILTGIPFMEAQAAAKPIILIDKIESNLYGCYKGDKIKLTAISGSKDITKKGTWKSSKKNVASVSKKGVLTAKKAGTTNITVKYKGKNSKKLMIIVDNYTANPESPSDTGTEPEEPSNPGTNPELPSVTGSHMIKYNVNSKDKSDKLSGSSTQYVSGEILKFNTSVDVGAGHKFLGWYDAPTGGNRIYETYKPTKDMTLYAHYTDKSVQRVTFVLGCNYGVTYSFMSGASKSITHYRDFDWLKQEDTSGPMVYGDADNVSWQHTYTVSADKKTFSVDDLPVPSVPGYTFDGWYTADTMRTTDGVGEFVLSPSAEKVEAGSKVDTGTTILYARFTKKITISFDDLRGGKYDDIVVDSYKSITDCGQKLPKPKIPGATFLGWTMDADNNRMGWSKDLVTNDSVFLNCIEWFGFMCSGCGSVSKHMQDCVLYDERDCDTGFTAVNDDYHVFEETDHITLYPAYNFQRVDLSFDPNGGFFPYDALAENRSLYFNGEKYNVNNNYDGIGVYPDGIGSQPYGYFPYPGHESDLGVDRGCWKYGNNRKTLPKVERDNYVFDKWVYLDEDGNEQEFTYSTILEKDMTIYAKWNPGKCMVWYDATDGVITKEERSRVGLNAGAGYQIATESTIAKDGKQMPVPVSSEGRQFLGWYTSDGKPFDENTQVLGDTTLYAHWES